MTQDKHKFKAKLSSQMNTLQQRVAEEKSRRIFSGQRDAFFVVELKTGMIIDANKEASKLVGHSIKEIKNMHFTELNPPEREDEWCRIFEKLSENPKIGEIETDVITNDGKIIPVSINTTLLAFEGKQVMIGIFSDITKRKQMEGEKVKLEQKLHRALKMEAIGTLAGGIAHDFNNILGAIFGYAELALDNVTDNIRAKQNIQGIIKAANRAKDLVQQILTFSRQVEHKQVPIRVGPILEEALKLLRSTLPTTIEIKTNIAESNSVVVADPTKIHQVIMNLCVNAGQAMSGKVGLLEVTLENIHLDVDSLSRKDLQPGEYVKLSVRDTGDGIPLEIIKRIFDPYFTTKGKEKGSGLGLSVVHGIVKESGGDISVYSEPGKGTVFNVFLPIVEIAEPPTFAEVNSIPGGDEHILLIDDEKVLVEIGKSMMDRLGYKVTTMTSSLEALELFQKKPDAFDLIITDQTMPKMTGLQLSDEIRRIRDDIPVILCTGFSESINKEILKAYRISAFVMKPINKMKIAQVIRDVLKGK